MRPWQDGKVHGCENTCAERKRLKVYITQNKFCYLFERPFKIQKNGVFLFDISFFVLEIFTFFYYANKISDDVRILQLKSSKN